MAKVYMLIGLPGCGKSTWTKDRSEKVFSSDEYRDRMFGGRPQDKQSHQKVFDQLHKDLAATLSEGVDCIYDATNLNRKRRKHFISQVARGHEVEAVLFNIPLNIVHEQNEQRKGDRRVPEEAIDRMLKGFHIPCKAEGFSKIFIVRRHKKWFPANKLPFYPVGYDQNNPHHTLDLEGHACMTQKNYMELTKSDTEYDFGYYNDAVYYHDIGKPMCREDREDGFSSYKGHENVSAYIYISQVRPDIPGALLISFHMMMHFAPDAARKWVTGDLYKMLKYLNKADSSAK